MRIIFEDVSYVYQEKSPMARRALYDVNLLVESGIATAVIGHTGSGKSTLIQHLNGLVRPTVGTVHIGAHCVRADEKKQSLKDLRQKVGVVFQFPEYQLFEETVEKDICFGPMNYGVSFEEARVEARRLVELLGLPIEVLVRSPFELSGGQMRRVAIAGILAMKPDVLVLDEPTAGLDPRGSNEIMALFARLKEELQLTVVLVSHSMDDVARYADEVIVLNGGTVFKKGTPSEVFACVDSLAEIGLSLPRTVTLQRLFEARFACQLSRMHFCLEDLVLEMGQVVKSNVR